MTYEYCVTVCVFVYVQFIFARMGKCTVSCKYTMYHNLTEHQFVQ